MKITIQGNFARALHAVMAKQDIRTYLNGVYFDVDDKKLVATDGHRLITVKVDVENSISIEKGAIFSMPEKPFKTDRRVTIETGRNPERYEEIVWTYYDRHYIIRKQVISHLVSGKFPDYIDIITDKYKSEKLYSIGFNPAYLIDVYMALDYKGGVKFNLGKDSNSVFKVDFGMSRDIEYYLMPMRT